MNEIQYFCYIIGTFELNKLQIWPIEIFNTPYTEHNLYTRRKCKIKGGDKDLYDYNIIYCL